MWTANGLLLRVVVCMKKCQSRSYRDCKRQVAETHVNAASKVAANGRDSRSEGEMKGATKRDKTAWFRDDEVKGH